MNFLPTITKLFIAGCCALIAFSAIGDNNNQTSKQEIHLTGVPLSVTTTTVTTTSTTTSTIPVEDFLSEVFPLEEMWQEDEVDTVEEPPPTTIAIVENSSTSDRWGVVSEEAMDIYEQEQTWLTDPVDYSDIPFLIDNLYGFWEKGTHIVDLQRMLGMDFVDGIYGPSTRRKHMEWFGSFEAAQRYFFDRETWYLETVRSSPDTEAGWKHNWNDWDAPPTLEQLVDIYFEPVDKEWALRVAFCESSALPHHTYSNAVSSALAVGWFQHLSKYWLQRAKISGWEGYDIFDSEPNVAVAAWLFYETGGAEKHWNPSRSCWKDTPHGQ